MGHGAPSSNALASHKFATRALASSMNRSRRQPFAGWVTQLKRSASARSKTISLDYVQWTFIAAVAVVIVGLIGVGLTFLH
jgi:hypothetical protein